MRRLALSACIVPLLALFILASPAQARLKWCRTDPIVRLNGVEVRILIDVPEEYIHLVDGPVSVEITTPESVEHEVIFTDPGYNGHGEVVTFTARRGMRGTAGTQQEPAIFHQPRELGTFAARIRVEVPIDEHRLQGAAPVPVQVEVIPGSARARTVRGTHERATIGVPISERIELAAMEDQAKPPFTDQAPSGANILTDTAPDLQIPTGVAPQTP